ncbi:type IV pilus biogenesis protein PilM [Christensenella intestinihominis]|uniref:hypothetical protein n=1 Tax=Christensenella intestinihominis TaxID=1851429 RepID=UPI0011CB3540|nr:hypothetical protein [Christensenella intestinihominis]
MIALDFTNLYIRAVNGKASGGEITITHAASAPLPEYMDADGVTDKNAMAGAVRGLLASGFSGGRVNVLVSKSNVISNEFVLPYEKNPIAMRNIVQGELYKSQTSDDSILDYTIQEVFPRDGSTFCRVQAYLAKRSLVESVSEILSLAGKKPSCYTVVQNCLCRLQHLGNGFSGGDIIIANVGSSRIHVTLLAQPNIALTRSDAVMPGRQALAAVVENRYDISAATEAATQNISKMMQYQSIKYPGRACDSIFISGDIATAEMAGNISAALGHPVSLLPCPSSVSAPNGFLFHQYAYATGALLEK